MKISVFNKTEILKYFKFICRLILCTSMVFFNDIWLRTYYVSFDKQLRYFDHFMAALVVCDFLNLLIKDKKFSCLLYIAGCLFWETIEFFQRGFFQYDQLIVDLLSTLIFYVLSEKIKTSKFKRKELIQNGMERHI